MFRTADLANTEGRWPYVATHNASGREGTCRLGSEVGTARRVPAVRCRCSTRAIRWVEKRGQGQVLEIAEKYAYKSICYKWFPKCFLKNNFKLLLFKVFSGLALRE